MLILCGSYFFSSGQVTKSSKGKSKYEGSDDDNDTFLDDFTTRHMSLVWCALLHSADMFFGQCCPSEGR
jgi:hypothetical protein